MKEHTQDQEIMQSAATAMKHPLQMQSSDRYDLDTHIRATQKAMDFCHEFASSNEVLVHPNADFDAIDDRAPMNDEAEMDDGAKMEAEPQTDADFGACMGRCPPPCTSMMY